MGYRQWAGISALVAASAFAGWDLMGLDWAVLPLASTAAAVAALVFLVLWLIEERGKKA